MLIVPFRADTLDRSPANRSRARSGNRPVSSTITRSYPDAWPAVRSADKVSSEPVELSITPGYGERRIRMSRFDASAISRTCRRSSPAFSLLILAIAPRQARTPQRAPGPPQSRFCRTCEPCSAPIRARPTTPAASPPQTPGAPSVHRCAGVQAGQSTSTPPTQPARPRGRHGRPPPRQAGTARRADAPDSARLPRAKRPLLRSLPDA